MTFIWESDGKEKSGEASNSWEQGMQRLRGREWAWLLWGRDKAKMLRADSDREQGLKKWIRVRPGIFVRVLSSDFSLRAATYGWNFLSFPSLPPSFLLLFLPYNCSCSPGYPLTH